MNKAEVNHYITINDDGVVANFFEGDNVSCYTENNECFSGKIISIGLWRDTDDSDLYDVIYLDTSKNARSQSYEIIKIEEITYLCKNTSEQATKKSMSLLEWFNEGSTKRSFGWM